MMIWEIESIEDYKELLKIILKEGQPIKVRSQLYTEEIAVILKTKWQPPEFFEENFPNFSIYMAQARAEYIWAKIPMKTMLDLSILFQEDENTRRAIIYKPDWYWEEPPEHINCILAYQFMKRNDKMNLHIFMRSSDFFNGFPYDWYAASQHLKWFIENEKTEKGEIYWYISNLHIRNKDLTKITKWLEGSQ